MTIDSTMQPSTALAPPDSPVRAPCGTTGTRSSVAVRMTCCTCSTVSGNTTTAGVPASQNPAMSRLYAAVTSGSTARAPGGSPSDSRSVRSLKAVSDRSPHRLSRPLRTLSRHRLPGKHRLRTEPPYHALTYRQLALMSA